MAFGAVLGGHVTTHVIGRPRTGEWFRRAMSSVQIPPRVAAVGLDEQAAFARVPGQLRLPLAFPSVSLGVGWGSDPSVYPLHFPW